MLGSSFCSSHREQLNEFESAVLLHSVLLVGSLDDERKKRKEMALVWAVCFEYDRIYR